MSFVSIQFIALLAVVVPLYYLLPFGAANTALLLASYFFYSYWYPPYLGLLLGTTLFDYVLARAIDRSPSAARRRALLSLSLTCNFGVLFAFKYSAMFVSLWRTGGGAGPDVSLALPIGISFYTFQEVGYVIDVYRRQIPAVQRFRDLSLFITFFPQLIAGPIERAGTMLPQFRVKHEVTQENVAVGLRLILLGFFKKLVIADRLAPYVRTVYADPSSHEPSVLMLATVFFSAQIYADFSAYSEIAIGSARILGFRLMTNFRQPYLAASVTDFWRRWHISLTTWFRDYVYVPMGGNRVGAVRHRVNILVVFLLSGLWHGAHPRFVLWGGLHGAALIAADAFAKIRRSWRVRIPDTFFRPAAWLATFVFVIAAWVPFRAGSLVDTWYIWTHLYPWPLSVPALARPAGGAGELAGMLLATSALAAIDLIEAWGGLWPRLVLWPRPVRWACYYAVSFCILWFGVWGQYEFIYFQF
jgi:alginate O-acetyltransferase complex protein AlgI